MRILLIANNSDHAAYVTGLLQKHQLKAVRGGLADAGPDGADWDVILLDPRLPCITGPKAMLGLRDRGIKTPVVVVSDTKGVAEMSRGFGFGAAGYVRTPVTSECLAAALYDALDWPTPPSSIVRVGELSVDLIRRTAMIGDDSVPLYGKEYAMLDLLARRCGEVLTKKDFLEYLYGGMDEPELKIIDVFMCILRKRLHAASGWRHHYIQTVWGKGYVLRDPDMDNLPREAAR